MSIQRRNSELVDLLRPDFVGNDSTAAPTFDRINVGTTGAGPGDVALSARTIHGTYGIRQVFVKAGIVDNVATGVFRINTVAAGNQGGGYSCTVHALIGHPCGAGSGTTSTKSFVAHFTHVNNVAGTPATSAVVEISESASAATNAAQRDIGAVTMTAVENGNSEVQVTFTIDLTGAAVSTATVICQVELVYYGYIAVPTMTAM